ncbi:hypothetical protein QJS66_18355 [Kocuria rhizophila]|nr:hypothetical protein QJS66_18355 [Kocuria rhizophila]
MTDGVRASRAGRWRCPAGCAHGPGAVRRGGGIGRPSRLALGNWDPTTAALVSAWIVLSYGAVALLAWSAAASALAIVPPRPVPGAGPVSVALLCGCVVMVGAVAVLGHAALVAHLCRDRRLGGGRRLGAGGSDFLGRSASPGHRRAHRRGRAGLSWGGTGSTPVGSPSWRPRATAEERSGWPWHATCTMSWPTN